MDHPGEARASSRRLMETGWEEGLRPEGPQQVCLPECLYSEGGPLGPQPVSSLRARFNRKNRYLQGFPLRNNYNSEAIAYVGEHLFEGTPYIWRLQDFEDRLNGATLPAIRTCKKAQSRWALVWNAAKGGIPGIIGGQNVIYRSGGRKRISLITNADCVDFA